MIIRVKQEMVWSQSVFHLRWMWTSIAIVSGLLTVTAWKEFKLIELIPVIYLYTNWSLGVTELETIWSHVFSL